MSAKGRCRIDLAAGVDAATVCRGQKEGPKPRYRGTGPKLFSKHVTRKLLQEQFHRPLEEAGKLWGVSTTIIKRVCRTHDIERWPYRQIQSAKKKIDYLQANLRRGKKSALERAKAEVSVIAIVPVKTLIIFAACRVGLVCHDDGHLAQAGDMSVALSESCATIVYHVFWFAVFIDISILFWASVLY